MFTGSVLVERRCVSVGELQKYARCDKIKVKMDGKWGRWTAYSLKGKEPELETCDQCGGSGQSQVRGLPNIPACERCRGEKKITAPSFLCCCCDAEINHNSVCNLHTLEEQVNQGIFSDWKDVKAELGIEPK